MGAKPKTGMKAGVCMDVYIAFRHVTMTLRHVIVARHLINKEQTNMQLRYLLLFFCYKCNPDIFF